MPTVPQILPASDAPTSSGTWRGHWPFIRAAASFALLSAFLMRQSAVIAPGYNLAAVSWTLTFLVLYFGLARAVFVRTHCMTYGGGVIRDATMARGELAFAAAMRRRRQGLLIGALSLLLVAAAVDYAAIDVGFQARRPFLLAGLAAMVLVWLLWCPVFLVASSLLASEPDATLRRARTLLRRLGEGPGLLAWIGVVLAICVVSRVTDALIEPPLRALVLALLPSPRAAYFVGIVLLAAQIAFHYWIQALYAAWLTPRLVRRERSGEIG